MRYGPSGGPEQTPKLVLQAIQMIGRDRIGRYNESSQAFKPAIQLLFVVGEAEAKVVLSLPRTGGAKAKVRPSL